MQAHISEALDNAGGATGITSRRPSSAGSALGAPSHTWGLTYDPFRVLQAGTTDAQPHMQLSSKGRNRASSQHGQPVNDVHSCDFPAAVAAPVDPIMPDACSTDFASVHARRPAFQAAFYFGARRTRPQQDSEPFIFGEHGPLAAGMQSFSTSRPDAQTPQESAAAAAEPQLGGAEPGQEPQRLRAHISCAVEQQGTPQGRCGDMCSTVDAMEVCGSGGRGKGMPQARHTQLLWPASLQKLRRGATRSPKVPPPDVADLDMQPLGRHISGGHSAFGCETPEAVCHAGKRHSGTQQLTEAFVECSENVPGRANRSVMHMAVESTPYEDGGRARSRARGGGGRKSSVQGEAQQLLSAGHSQLSQLRTAGQESLTDGGNAWQVGDVLRFCGSCRWRTCMTSRMKGEHGRLKGLRVLSIASMQVAGASPMQMDFQPSRLGQLHAVMEMSALDAPHTGAHLSGSVTQLVTNLLVPPCQQANMLWLVPLLGTRRILLTRARLLKGWWQLQEVHSDGTAQMQQWHIAMQSDELHRSSCSSSGEGAPYRCLGDKPSCHRIAVQGAILRSHDMIAFYISQKPGRLRYSCMR